MYYTRVVESMYTFGACVRASVSVLCKLFLRSRQ